MRGVIPPFFHVSWRRSWLSAGVYPTLQVSTTAVFVLFITDNLKRSVLWRDVNTLIKSIHYHYRRIDRQNLSSQGTDINTYVMKVLWTLRM